MNKQFVDIKTQSGLFHVKQHILLRVVSMDKICLGIRVVINCVVCSKRCIYLKDFFAVLNLFSCEQGFLSAFAVILRGRGERNPAKHLNL